MDNYSVGIRPKKSSPSPTSSHFPLTRPSLLRSLHRSLTNPTQSKGTEMATLSDYEESIPQLREKLAEIVGSESQADKFITSIQPVVQLYFHYIGSSESRPSVDREVGRLHRIRERLEIADRLLPSIRRDIAELYEALEVVTKDLDDLGSIGYIYFSHSRILEGEVFGSWEVTLRNTILPGVREATEGLRDPRKGRPRRDQALLILVTAIANASETSFAIPATRTRSSRFMKIAHAVLTTVGYVSELDSIRPLLDAAMPQLKEKKKV
jgi:hypothetical protein